MTRKPTTPRRRNGVAQAALGRSTTRGHRRKERSRNVAKGHCRKAKHTNANHHHHQD
jgi:hypothetical protein